MVMTQAEVSSRWLEKEAYAENRLKANQYLQNESTLNIYRKKVMIVEIRNTLTLETGVRSSLEKLVDNSKSISLSQVYDFQSICRFFSSLETDKISNVARLLSVFHEDLSVEVLIFKAKASEYANQIFKLKDVAKQDYVNLVVDKKLVASSLTLGPKFTETFSYSPIQTVKSSHFKTLSSDQEILNQQRENIKKLPRNNNYKPYKTVIKSNLIERTWSKITNWFSK